MKPTIAYATLAAALTLLPAASANSLFQGDYRTPGDNSLITDTLTGLHWLPVTYTAGESVLTAESQNPGFVLATAAQVIQLFNDAGGGFTAYDWTYRVGAPDETTAAAIVNDFGATIVFNFGGPFIDSELLGHVLGSNPQTYDMFEIDYRPSAVFSQFARGAEARLLPLGNQFGSASSNEGNFLVNTSSAIPEPATGLLLSLGLLMVLRAARGRGPRRGGNRGETGTDGGLSDSSFSSHSAVTRPSNTPTCTGRGQ